MWFFLSFKKNFRAFFKERLYRTLAENNSSLSAFKNTAHSFSFRIKGNFAQKNKFFFQRFFFNACFFFKKDFSFGFKPCSCCLKKTIVAENFFNVQFVFCQSACFVRADNARASECFNRGHFSYQCVSASHCLHSQGKRYCNNCGQSLWNCRDRKAYRSEKH